MGAIQSSTISRNVKANIAKAQAAAKAKEEAAAKSKPKPKAAPKPAPTPQEKIRSQYEKDTKSISSLGKKGQVVAQKITGTPLDTSGVNELKNMALTPSKDSVWLKMAQEQQGLNEKNLMDSAAKNAATAGDTAKANLAMSGGLRGGAAERLAGGAADQGLLARQGVANQGAMERSGLGMQAEANRLNALSQLPGAQLGVANYGTDIEKFNTGNENIARGANVQNAVADLAARNSFKTNMYNQDMTQLAADKQAAALEASRSPGLLEQFGKMNPLQKFGIGSAISPVVGIGSALGVGGGGGKIICTEYCRQGWISKEVLRGDLEYAEAHLSRETRANYLMWAQYVVPLMQRFPILLYLFWPITYNWVHYMAWKMGCYHKKPALGPFVEKYATKVSNVLGRSLRRLKQRRRVHAF